MNKVGECYHPSVGHR